VVERLAFGPATVSDLAAGSEMALPSFCQHLDVLEQAGIVQSRKQGRVRTYEIVPDRLAAAEQWLVEQRTVWARRLDSLDSYLATLKEKPS
jgi:DNA-binding transcriptional ArsR family regulator